MNQNEKIPSFRLLMLITTPKLAERAAEVFRKGAIPIQYRLNAEGTASTEIMDVLGLGSIDKRVLVSIMPKRFSDMMLEKLHSELKMNTVNSGIAFTIPLTGANNLMLRMLVQANGGKQTWDERKDEIDMTETKHVLIAAIVNRGFSGNVMNAAREAGAVGGTIMHSRQIGNEEALGFWGLSVQDEKEIVLILSDIENKVGIMQKISTHCGLNSDAQGIVMSLPIDSVIGVQNSK